MKDCQLIVVLLNKNTWKRKHVDWEISTALRDTKFNSRKGLLAITMPDYGDAIDFNNSKTPNRLIRNINNGYCEVMDFSEIGNSAFLKEKILSALKKSERILPVNNDKLRRRNTK